MGGKGKDGGKAAEKGKTKGVEKGKTKLSEKGKAAAKELNDKGKGKGAGKTDKGKGDKGKTALADKGKGKTWDQYLNWEPPAKSRGKGGKAMENGKTGKGNVYDSGKGKSKDKGKEQEKGKSFDGGKGGKGKEKGGKGKAAAGSEVATLSKENTKALEAVLKTTAMKTNDIDPKAIQLLEALGEVGKAEAACEHLAKSLEGVSREKVSNWKGYVFTLLRGFDAEVYQNLKEQRGRPRPRGRAKDDKLSGGLVMTALKATAPSFTPGAAWPGNTVGVAPPTLGATGIQFKVECQVEKGKGETIVVIGGPAELGAWDAARAQHLTSPDGVIWTSAPIKITGAAEYKFAVMAKDRTILRWEGFDGNRKLMAGQVPTLVKFGER